MPSIGFHRKATSDFLQQKEDRIISELESRKPNKAPGKFHKASHGVNPFLNIEIVHSENTKHSDSLLLYTTTKTSTQCIILLENEINSAAEDQ